MAIFLKNKDVTCRRRLVEWGIVFLFLSVISAIAIPDYLRFRNKSYCNSPVKANLVSLFNAQMKYHLDRGEYASHTHDKNCLELLEWEPRCKSEIMFSYYCDTAEWPNEKGGSCPNPRFIPVTKDSFTIIAVGNIDSDETIDVWTINDAKELKNIVNDVVE